jgi:hypothetical protein
MGGLELPRIRILRSSATEHPTPPGPALCRRLLVLRGRLSLSLVWFSIGRVGAARGFSRLSEGLQLSAHILPLLFGLLSLHGDQPLAPDALTLKFSFKFALIYVPSDGTRTNADGLRGYVRSNPSRLAGQVREVWPRASACVVLSHGPMLYPSAATRKPLEAILVRFAGIHRRFITHCYRRECPAVALQSRVLHNTAAGLVCGPPSVGKLVTSGGDGSPPRARPPTAWSVIVLWRSRAWIGGRRAARLSAVAARARRGPTPRRGY